MSLRNIQMILTTIISEKFPYTLDNIFVKILSELKIADIVLNTEKFLLLHHRTFKLLIMEHKIARD